jgi:hypothetical protein
MSRFFGSRSKQVAPFNPLIEIINSDDEEKNITNLIKIFKEGLFQAYFDNLKSDDRNKMNAKMALLNRMKKAEEKEESDKEEEEEERFPDVKNNKYSPTFTRKTKGGKRSHTKKQKHKRHTYKHKHKRTHRR